MHTAQGLPRGQPDVRAAPATLVYDGTSRRGSRFTHVQGGLHLVCLCTVWACVTMDIPNGLGGLVVCSSPSPVPESRVPSGGSMPTKTTQQSDNLTKQYRKSHPVPVGGSPDHC